jgi:hypothetical protein
MIDVADGVNFVTSKRDDLVQEFIVCACGLIVGDRAALAHLAIHEVVRRDGVLLVDQQAARGIDAGRTKLRRLGSIAQMKAQEVTSDAAT